MGFFKNRLNNRFLVAFNSSRFVMALMSLFALGVVVKG